VSDVSAYPENLQVSKDAWRFLLMMHARAVVFRVISLMRCPDIQRFCSSWPGFGDGRMNRVVGYMGIYIRISPAM
jgi:hypothetical protein